MANTSYKPLWGNSGGGCVFIVTTSTEAEASKPGIEGKIYLFTDTGELNYWDKVAQKFRIVNTAEGMETYYEGGIGTFPIPGRAGQIYIDKITGKRYIWQYSGFSAIKVPNFQYSQYRGGYSDNCLGTTAATPSANLLPTQFYDTTIGKTIWYIDLKEFGQGVFQVNEYLPISQQRTEAKFVSVSNIYPIYYDIDELDKIKTPPTIDFFVNNPLYVVYLPKSKEQYGNTKLVQFLEKGEYNYCYLIDNVQGSYVEIGG